MTPIFTQKHFVAVAKLLKDIRPVQNENTWNPAIAKAEYLMLSHQWDNTVKAFCGEFYVQNSKFDKKRFVKASGGLILG